jgi:hypothetical protein
MAQRVSGFRREPDETYETSVSWPVQLIARHLRERQCRHVWESANGPNSKLAQVLCAEGFKVTVTCDDFLARCALPESDIDSIVTNPPYGLGGRLAQRFIEHALELAPVVAMLLRVDFDSGVTRRHLFEHCPAFALKLTLLDRIVWFENPIKQARPSDNHSWFLWDQRHRGQPAIAYAHSRDLVQKGI